MIGAPNSLNLNCKVRVMKEAPGPSISEEIADIFYIRAAGRRARSARRPAVQNVSVIAQGHEGGHASPIEAAGQWFY